MRIAGLARNVTAGTLSAKAKRLVVPCVPGAYGKCECGATLKTRLDRQLHICITRNPTDQIYGGAVCASEMRIL